MDRLGHSDDQITKNVYVTKEMKKEVSQKFVQLIRSFDYNPLRLSFKSISLKPLLGAFLALILHEHTSNPYTVGFFGKHTKYVLY